MLRRSRRLLREYAFLLKRGVGIAFPTDRPPAGSFLRPREDESWDLSPPGFCWWRAGKPGRVAYRLEISDGAGEVIYTSPPLRDPVHIPAEVLPAGRFSWTAHAVDARGRVRDTLRSSEFTIAEAAIPQPWVPAEAILARVPRERPRLLFPRSNLDAVRASLDTTRRAAFANLTFRAREALRLRPRAAPSYDRIASRPERLLAYKRTYEELLRHHEGMVSLSLMWLLTEERSYGDLAKSLLLGVAEWDPQGISSILSPHGDEVGLGVAKSAAQCFDWLYDLLTDAERETVEKMLVARADQMLRRLTQTDLLAFPELSHAGRLPGFLVEHAIALAEEPRAEEWLDYAMRAFLTVFPHWGGHEGGWAEGIAYAAVYNAMYVTPFESLRTATGIDLWDRPFYRGFRRFILYNTSPRGEVMPFGDIEDEPVSNLSENLRGLMQFHASRYQDPAARWWVEQVQGRDPSRYPVALLPEIILPDTVQPAPPDDLPQDAAFRGVGWAALHGDLSHPERDLTVMFKSSPYGAVSHSHADQNSFAIMKGGKALAIPGGRRYPKNRSPFHEKYTRQTIAHNGILVDGHGQIDRDARAAGRLVSFETHPHLGYACGEAASAYGKRLSRFLRHVLLVRPSLVLVVDDLAGRRASVFRWLLHARARPEIDESAQRLISRRDGVSMTVQLVTPGGFQFELTDEWPVDPREGFPGALEEEPARQWHFSAATCERSARRRIAAIIKVETEGEATQLEVRPSGASSVEVRADFGDGEAEIALDLAVERPGDRPIFQTRYRAASGETETLSKT